MGKVIRLIMLLVFVACGSTKVRETPLNTVDGPEGLKARVASVASDATNGNEATNPETNGNTTRLKADFSDEVRIGGIMNFLASDALKGRDSGSEGIAKAADFIETIFRQNRIAPYFGTYKDTLSNFSKPAYNVVGVLEGNDPKLKHEFIVIGAHYDHIGIISPVNGDTIANGANDNASGTTVVLELARYFGNARTNKRSLIFALFSAEEKGLLGSNHLAKKLKAQNLDLYAMLNFEMVGVPLMDKDYFMYVTGYEMSNLAEVSNQYTNEKLIGFLPTAKEFNLFKRSDNYPFHEAFGVPSQTYCTFDFTNFDQYHKVGDEVSLMDFGHMATVVNKTIPVLSGIINATTREIKYK
ncbi:M28 family peptidase [Flavobacteriaceae bacterium 3-367]